VVVGLYQPLADDGARADFSRAHRPTMPALCSRFRRRRGEGCRQSALLRLREDWCCSVPPEGRARGLHAPGARRLCVRAAPGPVNSAVQGRRGENIALQGQGRRKPEGAWFS